MILEHPNPIEVGGLTLAGWESILPLNQAENECLDTGDFPLPPIMSPRHLVLLHPENAEYVMITSKKGSFHSPSALGAGKGGGGEGVVSAQSSEYGP